MAHVNLGIARRGGGEKTFVFIALVLAAAAFRLADRHGSSSLWTDEFATLWVASASSLSECFQRASLTQGQYPLYFLLEWCVLRVLPANEFSLRLFSLLASSISPGVVYLIASDLLASKRFAGGASPSLCERDMGGDGSVFRAFAVVEAPAIFAGALFALNVNEIYYAQEARPYALATLCALLAVLAFIRVVESGAGTGYLAAAAFFSVSACYFHYVFGVVVVLQNLWVAVHFKRFGAAFIKRWTVSQAVAGVLCLPLVFHLLPILRDTGRWTWLRRAGLADGVAVFADMIDWKFAAAFIVLCLWALTCEGGASKIAGLAGNFNTLRFRFAVLWLILPPVAACLATFLLRSSLIDARYMLLALPGLFVLMGCLADLIMCPGRRVFLPVFVLCLYSITTLAPCWRSEGRFCRRIPHDWRSALAVLSRQAETGDAVLLRSGFIKENWVPESRNPLILKYAQAPVRSFYFRSTRFERIAEPACFALDGGRSARSPDSSRCLSVFSLPYSYEKRFTPYLDFVLARLAAAERVWILGVDPPNTNYPLENTINLFPRRRVLFRKSFGGVWLCLLK